MFHLLQSSFLTLKTLNPPLVEALYLVIRRHPSPVRTPYDPTTPPKPSATKVATSIIIYIITQRFHRRNAKCATWSTLLRCLSTRMQHVRLNEATWMLHVACDSVCVACVVRLVPLPVALLQNQFHKFNKN